jgi:hypothetical protein
MKNLKILNVVFIDCGILSSVVSFPMTEENESEQVRLAEELFIEKISSCTDDFDKDEVLDNGYFDCDGVYVALDWSIIG